jgi:hypothetical protein
VKAVVDDVLDSVVLRVVGVLLIVVGVTVVICEVWAVDDVVDPGTVSVDAVGSSIS